MFPAKKYVPWCFYLETYKMLVDKILANKYEEYDRNDQEIEVEVDDSVVGTVFCVSYFTFLE